MSEFVSICEVGPRDGLQIAKTRMATDTKVRWIAAIAAAGVREIEVGSFVPARVIPQLSDTPEIVARVLETVPGLTVQAPGCTRSASPSRSARAIAAPTSTARPPTPSR
jgi:hydroxymethylglutaryl-CoA lyase